MDRTLSKKERLYLRDEIEALFAARSAFVSFPVRVLWLLTPSKPDAPSVKILISIPKRRIRRAVRRNRLKRLFREAYRLSKESFVPLVPEGQTLSLGFVYVADEVCTMADAEKALSKARTKLAHLLSPANGTPENDPI